MDDKLLQETLSGIAVAVAETSIEVKNIATGQKDVKAALGKINGRLRDVEGYVPASDERWKAHQRAHDKEAEVHREKAKTHQREHEDLKSKNRIADVGSYIMAGFAGFGAWLSGQ